MPYSSVQCEVGFRSLCFWYAGGSVPCGGDRGAMTGDQAERWQNGQSEICHPGGHNWSRQAKGGGGRGVEGGFMRVQSPKTGLLIMNSQ